MNSQIVAQGPQFDPRLWACRYQVQESFKDPDSFQIEPFKHLIYPLDLDGLSSLQEMIHDLFRNQQSAFRIFFNAKIDQETIDLEELTWGGGKVVASSFGIGCLSWEAFKEGAKLIPTVGLVISVIGEGYWGYKIYCHALPDKRKKAWEEKLNEVLLKLERTREGIYHAIESTRSHLANRRLVTLEGQLSGQNSIINQLRDDAHDSNADLGLATASIENLRREYEEAIGGLQQTHSTTVAQLRRENYDMSVEMGLSTNAIFNLRQDQEAAQIQVQEAHNKVQHANNELATLRASLSELRQASENSVAQLTREFRSMQMAMRGNATDTSVQNLLQERENFNQRPSIALSNDGSFNNLSEEFIHVPDIQQPEPVQQQMGTTAEVADGNQASPQDALANFYLIDADQ